MENQEVNMFELLSAIYRYDKRGLPENSSFDSVWVHNQKQCMGLLDWNAPESESWKIYSYSLENGWKYEGLMPE